MIEEIGWWWAWFKREFLKTRGRDEAEEEIEAKLTRQRAAPLFFFLLGGEFAVRALMGRTGNTCSDSIIKY